MERSWDIHLLPVLIAPIATLWVDEFNLMRAGGNCVDCVTNACNLLHGLGHFVYALRQRDLTIRGNLDVALHIVCRNRQEMHDISGYVLNDLSVGLRLSAPEQQW